MSEQIKSIVYSLAISDDNGNAVDVLNITHGDEVIDIVSDFAIEHKFQRKQLNQIVNHLCSIGEPVKCSRRRARKFLFELYMRDSNLKDPLFVKVNRCIHLFLMCILFFS